MNIHSHSITSTSASTGISNQYTFSGYAHALPSPVDLIPLYLTTLDFPTNFPKKFRRKVERLVVAQIQKIDKENSDPELGNKIAVEYVKAVNKLMRNNDMRMIIRRLEKIT